MTAQRKPFVAPFLFSFRFRFFVNHIETNISCFSGITSKNFDILPTQYASFAVICPFTQLDNIILVFQMI